MKAYINKAAVVAEIEIRIEAHKETLKNCDSSISEMVLKGSMSAYQSLLYFLDTLEVKEIGADLGDPQGDIGVNWVQEEPVSNDIEAEFVLYLKRKFNIPQEGNKLKTNGWNPSPYDLLDIAKHFAQWQKEQMEKNRIAHCDNITEEQYNLETGFIDEHLKKYNRIPTILDTIEYGMQKQITKACEWLKINKDHPLIGCEDPCLSGYLTDEFIEEFKKAMEDKL